MPASCAFPSAACRISCRCQTESLRRMALLPPLLLRGWGTVNTSKTRTACAGAQATSRLAAVYAKVRVRLLLFANQPFERSTDTTCVSMLCLVRRKFALNAFPRFVVAFIGYFYCFPAHKEAVAIGVDGNKCIRLLEINAHQMNTMWLRNFQRHRHTTQQPAIAFDHAQAVNLFGGAPCLLEGIRYSIEDMLATCYCPDRERTIFAKIGIAPTLTDEEQGTSALEQEGTFGRSAITSGTGIGASGQTNGRARHLAAQRAKHLPIALMMQRQSAKRLPIVLARFGELLLHLLKRGHCLSEVVIIGQQNCHRAFDIHGSNMPLNAAI
jgi:hypothetical protein